MAATRSPAAILLTILVLAARSAHSTSLLVTYDVQNSQMLDAALSRARQQLNSSLDNVVKVPLDAKIRFDNVDSVCQAYEKVINGSQPLFVVDLTVEGLTSSVVKTFSRQLGVPTVSGSYVEMANDRVWNNISVKQNGYLVQISQPGDVLPNILSSVAIMQNMTNAAVFYDSSIKLDYKLTRLFRNRTLRQMTRRINEEQTKIINDLRQAQDKEMFNFFVLGTVDSINRVLAAASQVNFFGKKYSWYAITKDTSDISFEAENASVVFMKPAATQLTRPPSSGGPSDSVLDLAFYTDLIVRSVAAFKDLTSSGVWHSNLTYVPCSMANGAPVVRDNLNLRAALASARSPALLGPVVVSDNTRSLVQFDMAMFQVTVKNRRLAEKVSLGTWTAGVPGQMQFVPGKSLSPFAIISVYRVTVVVQAPFVMKRVLNGTVQFYGYCIDLIQEISKILKFEYDIYETPDRVYGNMDKDMNWNGMIRQLMDKKADIGLGALAVMAERENVIDYTVPYYDLVGISILMKNPTVYASLFKFLTVMDNSVWFSVLGAYFVTSFVLWIIDRWSPYSFQNNKEKYANDPLEEQREFTLKESFWFCMTSLTPQGGGETPKHLSGRLVTASWWLFGFIIIASYTANLAAFLTISRLNSPVNSLDDLAAQYSIQFSPVRGSYPMDYFERMAYIEQRLYEFWKSLSMNSSLREADRIDINVWDYPVSNKYTEIWLNMKDAGMPETFEDALVRVRDESGSGFALLGDATDIRYQVLTNCDLQMIGEEFSRKPYAVAVQEGSALRDLLNQAILELLNQRTLETLKDRWWSSNPEKKKCVAIADQSDGISIENIGGVFIVIVFGIVLACITLAIEYCWYKVHGPNPEEMETNTQSDKREREEESAAEKEGRFRTEYGYYGDTNSGDGARERRKW